MTQQTTDYSKFIRPNWQRQVNNTHVSNIQESMRNNGNKLHLEPIKCKELKDGNLLVLDGQHRLAAAESLGETIHYQIVETGDLDRQTIRDMSRTQKRWSKYDVLSSYAATGSRSAYVFMKETLEEYGLNASCISLMTGFTNQDREDFENGRTAFSMDERTRIQDFFGFINEAEEILGSDVKKLSIMRALKELFYTDGFCKERMLRRMYSYGESKFKPQPGWTLNVEMLKRLYNYRTNQSERL